MFIPEVSDKVQVSAIAGYRRRGETKMKVLIISHVPVTTQNNMGKTFLSLFSVFEQQELCQLYIYPAIPDVDRCSSYYRVTDKDVLRSLLLKKPGGELDKRLIRENSGMYEHARDEGFYRSRKNKSALRRILRDLLWCVSRWDNDRLDAWLDREKPDCIFVAPGVAKFLYNIALRISRKRKIPIVSYICDEYYFVREPETALDRLRLRLLQGKIRQLMKASSHLVAISEELRNAYADTFGVAATTLMTGTEMEASRDTSNAKAPGEICYFGNIRCNRFLSLAEIGKTLDEINREKGTDVKLKIYSAEKNNDILNVFSGIRSVELGGFVTGDDFRERFRSAELLLHTEAFDDASADFVKHSMSTKIADSLASGIPLLAYGPEQITSMRYLIRNECALTAVCRQELKQMLLTALLDGEQRKKCAENARMAAERYHNGEENSRRLKKILADAAGKARMG